VHSAQLMPLLPLLPRTRLPRALPGAKPRTLARLWHRQTSATAEVQEPGPKTDAQTAVCRRGLCALQALPDLGAKRAKRQVADQPQERGVGKAPKLQRSPSCTFKRGMLRVLTTRAGETSGETSGFCSTISEGSCPYVQTRVAPEDIVDHVEERTGNTESAGRGLRLGFSGSGSECLDEVGITAPTLLSCLAGQGAEADAGVTQGLQQRGESGPLCVNTLGGELQREEDPGRPRSHQEFDTVIVGEGPADASRHGEALCGDEGMLVASSASDTECLDEVGITAPTLLSCLAGQGAGVHETGRSNSITYNAEDKDACCQCIYWICDMC